MWFERMWHKYLFGKTVAWCREERSPGGDLIVHDWNSAYAESLRQRLDPDQVKMMTDQQVVDLWIGRYNHENSEPRLDMVHGKVNTDGTISVKLDWNDAFIRQLKTQGYNDVSEDEMIRQYLAQVTAKIDQDFQNDPGFEAAMSLPNPADFDAMIKSLDPKVIRQIEQSIGRR